MTAGPGGLLMQPVDVRKLHEDAELEILERGSQLGIIGLSSVTAELVRLLGGAGLDRAVQAVYVSKNALGPGVLSVPVRPLESLLDDHPDVLVVASDDDKEDLLLQALPYISGTPKIIVAGYGHLRFREPLFEELTNDLLVPSIANGYPDCLVHVYQCLVNAAKLNLEGAVCEFGTFKGGTSVFMAKVAKRFGKSWPVISFDTFDGFPLRRSPLDMYAHPGAEFKDVEAVRTYTRAYGVKLIDGDICETAQKVANLDHVLTFIDTDNYSSGMAAIEAVRDRIMVGGAIVFDHFTGRDKFRYTLGERLAARTLLDDDRFFNLHGTGVFLRQR